MSEVDQLQDTNNGRHILERSIQVNDGVSPCHVPSDHEPPDHEACDQEDNPPKAESDMQCQWFCGILYLLIAFPEILMKISIKIGCKSRWIHEIKAQVLKCGDFLSSKADKGVPCACPPTTHQCTIHGVTQRRCSKAENRSCDGLPILLDSDDERGLEDTDRRLKSLLEAKRYARSVSTLQMDKKYRSLLRNITFTVSQLIATKNLPYDRLKRWLYLSKPSLRNAIKEEKPSVEKMLNEFYPQWFDTNRIHQLVKKIEEHTGGSTITALLDEFEGEADHYLLQRVFLHGKGKGEHLIALFSIDPEWTRYQACNLHQLHRRVRKVLQRKTVCKSVMVYFCSVLKECLLLNHVEAFIQDMKTIISKESETTPESCKEVDFLCPLGIDEVNCNGPTAPVCPEKMIIKCDTPIKGCSCALLDHACGANEHFTMSHGQSIKSFLNLFGD